jgi:hypothetical protein
LQESDSIIQIAYNLSGHIHLSDQHLFAAKVHTKDGKSSIKVGGHSDNIDVDLKISFIKSMIEVSNLVLILIGQWETTKKDK